MPTQSPVALLALLQERMSVTHTNTTQAMVFSKRQDHHAAFEEQTKGAHTNSGRSRWQIQPGKQGWVPALVHKHSGLHAGGGMKACVRQMAFQVLLM